MIGKKSFVLAAMGLVLAGGAVTGASAETTWQRHHPRRVEVNHRLAHQNRRIREERREGELTGAQAAALHRDDHKVRAEERSMASLDNGHITKTDQRALNQQENAVSGQIPR